LHYQLAVSDGTHMFLECLFCKRALGRAVHSFLYYLQSLLTIYMVAKVTNENIGYFISSACVSIILYADNIILITPNVFGLQWLLTVCENELVLLDTQINVKNHVHSIWSKIWSREC
jgi:hypothetical protein